MPSRPRAPSTLSRAQGPRGTLPGARVPRGPRPCSRAMSVSTPHSSRNTNRSGATPPTPVAASVAHTARAAATAASSCSAARKVRFFHVQPHRRSARPTVQGWTRTPVRSASRSRHSARVRWFVSPSRPRSAAATSPLIFGFWPPPILLAARRPSSRAAAPQRYAVERPTANRRAAAPGVSPASIATRARSRRSVEYDPAIGTSVPYMATAVPTFTRYALALLWDVPLRRALDRGCGRGGSDAGERDVAGLGGRAGALAGAVPVGTGPRSAAALGVGLPQGPDPARRAQERRAAGRPGGARWHGAAAPLHRRFALGDRAARGRPGGGGGPAGRRPRGGAGDRRHRPAQGGQALGRGGAAVLRLPRQARQLPGPGLAHPGQGRGAGARGAAPVPAGRVDRRSGALRPRRRARGAPPPVGEARDRARGGGPGHRRRRAFRPRAGGRRLRRRRLLPPGPESARAPLGGRRPEGAERLPGRGRAAVADGGQGSAAQAPGAERGPGRGRGRLGGGRVAPHRLAARYQGAARGRVRRPAGAPGRGRAAPRRPAPARGRGLAGRRAPRLGREEVLPRQPARGDPARGAGGHDRGALGVRAGAPAAEGGAGARPFRGPLLARPAPPRAPVPARFRLPAAPAARGKKASPPRPSPARRPGRACPPSGGASWPCLPASCCAAPAAGSASSITSDPERPRVVLEAVCEVRQRVAACGSGGRGGAA